MEGARGCNAETRADPGDDVRRVFDGGAAAVGATGVDAPCETTRRVAIVASSSGGSGGGGGSGSVGGGSGGGATSPVSIVVVVSYFPRSTSIFEARKSLFEGSRSIATFEDACFAKRGARDDASRDRWKTRCGRINGFEDPRGWRCRAGYP